MERILRKICLWIKEYKHPLRVIGGIFFGLALISGIFWLVGNDIEPLAYFFGLLSSLFLASPSMAEYFLPDRKPVRHMTFEEILEFVPKTDSERDWHGITTDWISEYFLKEDPRLRYRSKYIDEGVQNDDFIEPWANNHPNPKATGYWCNLFYDGAFLDRIILVSIDGGKATIPPPDIETGKISKHSYHVAKIHDSTNTLDSYIQRSKLEVSDS
jgi:hypothetical protein